MKISNSILALNAINITSILLVFSTIIPTKIQAKTPDFYTAESTLITEQTIAQLGECTTPMNGIIKLRHSAGAIIHESTLYMEGCEGKMTTTFFNAASGKTEQVEQKMSQRSSAKGLFWLGFEPMYAGTNNPHPSYNADNLFFQVNTGGEWNVANCDDAGTCSPVEIVNYQQQ